MAPSEAAWERLGELLTQRRTQLDPRYARRTTFAKERGLNYRVAYEVETNRRHNFGDGTLAVIESAYELVPGSLKRTLNNGPLEPAGRPAVPSAPSADEPEPVSPAVADAIASLIALLTPAIDTEIRRARLRLQRQDVLGREVFTSEPEPMVWDLAQLPEFRRIRTIAALRAHRLHDEAEAANTNNSNGIPNRSS